MHYSRGSCRGKGLFEKKADQRIFEDLKVVLVHPGEEYCGMVLRAFGKVAEPALIVSLPH
jgi:hypothetical protein